MSSVSNELATVISEVRHDTNNSLMAIFGYLELLLGREDLPDPVMAKLKSIETEAYKIRDHIARTAFVRKPNS
jgi:signal transduction histidine kinase